MLTAAVVAPRFDLVISLRPDIQVETFGEDAAVVDLTSNELFRLNPVAAFVAALLQSPTETETLVAAVTEEFDVSTAIARQDVETFVLELRALGWIDES